MTRASGTRHRQRKSATPVSPHVVECGRGVGRTGPPLEARMSSRQPGRACYRGAVGCTGVAVWPTVARANPILHPDKVAIVIVGTVDTLHPGAFDRLLAWTDPGWRYRCSEDAVRTHTSHCRPHRIRPAGGHGPPQPIPSLTSVRSVIPRAPTSRVLTFVRPRDSARQGTRAPKCGEQKLPITTIAHTSHTRPHRHRTPTAGMVR
jgi:hypothetical protein